MSQLAGGSQKHGCLHDMCALEVAAQILEVRGGLAEAEDQQCVSYHEGIIGKLL